MFLRALRVALIAGVAVGSVAATTPLAAQDAGRPAMQAVRLVGPEPAIDGRLDDAQWATAPVADGFSQFQPEPGAPASFRTEARVLYGDDALFVAIRAHDPSPDSIVAQLTRRDVEAYADVVGVVIDSYNDQRTAFHFEVNAAGVQRDLYRFDDVREDATWDAVWSSAVAHDAEGWSAELRIPYSQLRFREGDRQEWGINFLRLIARRGETTLWAPTSPVDGAIVSRFGRLDGLDGIDPPRRLEVIPYSVARLDRAPGNTANPYYTKNDLAGTLGADVRFGITSDLTLTLTLNPDFGQVEADPAQVNLSAFEIFLPERRPFFVEGANLFNVGLSLGGSDESLFYSRRIGRAPRGQADPLGGFVEQDEQTTILGAWKLSGKTASGWSIGLLNAVTQEERARITPSAGGEFESPVEPFTNYAVARIQKDFRQGRSALGFVSSSVNRGADVANRLALPTGAYSAGIDVRHRFANDEWQISGYLIGSHVRGSEDAIQQLQQAPAHLYQRPDAEHLAFDSTRTSLGGTTFVGSISKLAGGNWRFSTGVQGRSPGFDTNDAGFLRTADYLGASVYVGYDQPSPQGPFRRWRLNGTAASAWSWGGEPYQTSWNLNGNAQFSNFWTAFGGFTLIPTSNSHTLLRGGPMLKIEGSRAARLLLATDGRADLMLQLMTDLTTRPESESHAYGISPSVRWRPSTRLNLTTGLSWRRNVDDRQWIGRIGTEDAPNWLLGRLEQSTAALTARFDLALSPTLSVQVYAEPFVSAGRYVGFRRVADPQAGAYADRFDVVPHTADDGRIEADLDGDGTAESFGSPDFTIRQFRSNTVLRWEWRPGSTFFVVWAQGRNGFANAGDFDLASDVDALFGIHPRNTFMVKMSYWLGG